ncbi:MAG TPA: LPS assembly lipoprotein LptE [Gallionellaceae bacterium]|nr:LPS assembly lipoprotein LptE [Gallionellaceae bacterium]
MSIRAALLVVATLLLSACGFHLRGHNLQAKEYAFHSIYLMTRSETPFTTELRANLALNKIELASTPGQADLTLEVVAENASKQIMALSGTGQVREYQLRYSVSLRAYDNQQNDWLNADEIMLQRSLTFDDSQILSKEQEEGMIMRDMRADAVQQVLRRLSRAKPRPVEAPPQP